MQTFRRLGFFTIASVLFLAAHHKASAQVSVRIGEPPVCPYGYYEAPPGNCEPDGFYGPEWF